MFSTGELLILSLVLFIFLAWFFSFEKKRDKRFFQTLREYLDNIVSKTAVYLALKWTYVERHIIKLSWYYGVHKVLRLTLGLLVKSYDYLEEAFTSNRDRARQLKIEKRNLNRDSGHLGQVADHKASVSLSPQQKKKLLQKKLERG